jgi:hypothetical protein
MRLSADNIIEIIKNETLSLVENTLEDLDDLEQLSKMLTVMNSETREKFTIQGSGEDVVTLQSATGEEPFDVSKEEFQKNYVLPKDAVDDDDEQIHGDKDQGGEPAPKETDESIHNLKALVKEAMGL